MSRGSGKPAAVRTVHQPPALVLLACDPGFRAGQSRTERLCPETLCGNLPPDRRRESAVLFQRIFEGAGDVSAVFVGFPEKDEKTDAALKQIYELKGAE